ncbi:MAG: hypothetical protein ACPL1D_00430 [Microgenomates group bacterium]
MEKLKGKKILIISTVLIPILILLFLKPFAFKNKKVEEKTTERPTSVLIPTVDNSVKVSLTSTMEGKEVLLLISNIPPGTNSIDYELSYQTVKQGLQGVIGTINLKNNENEIKKKITLGTCSSGTCVYHEVVGKINLSLKFIGDYGEKIFEKEYSL